MGFTNEKRLKKEAEIEAILSHLSEEKMEEMAQKEKKRTKIYMIISIVLVSSCFLFATICLFINLFITMSIYKLFF